MLWLAAFQLLLTILALILLVRVHFVSKFRLRLIDKVFETIEYQDRIKEFDKVSFHTMVWKFWKPLKVTSFYKKDFTK